MEQDIEQAVEDEAHHAKRPRNEEPDIGFYDRAYANTLVPRVMGASSKTGKDSFSKHDQADFRQAVLERYGALDPFAKDFAWCHITNCWWLKESVKAAHLVPKSLSGNELAFLFGVKTLVLHDPKNGISLHKKIELALDTGKIAIVPSPTEDYAACIWKCVLVDQSIRNEAACRLSVSEPILWKDLDGRELHFLTANRPARRYLYFRFIITYLHAKQSGNSGFTSTVDSRETFWASPGGYLERSTLTSTARNISGVQFPPAITVHTFDASPLASTTEDIAIIIATELQDAVVASLKRLDGTDESDEDMDDDEGD